MFETGDATLDLVLHLLAVLVIAFAVLEYIIYKKQEWVATNLTLAEREFNKLIASGVSHGGRRDRVAERREWNEMVDPKVIQFHQKGFRTVAHELVAENEKELSGKNATMGKASMTSFLLRELYLGNIDAAQAKIHADVQNSDGKKLPYIAPGIYELVGFEHYDKNDGFPKGAGVEKWLLKRVVRYWKFPQDLRVTHTVGGVTTFRDPFDAITYLNQQNL